MDESYDFHLMIHHHLVKMGLFADNSDQYVMPLFPLNDLVFQTFIAMSDVESENNQLPMDIPFNDVAAMKWLLHVKSFFLFLQLNSNQDQVLPSVINVITKFYQKFICETQDEMPKNDFNEIVQTMLQHLTLLFEKENFMEVKTKYVLQIFTKMAEKPFDFYSPETHTCLFKIILGICDFSVNDEEALGVSSKIIEELFDLLFWLLIIYKNNENWTLFDEVTSKWKYNQYFINAWMKFFNACFGVFLMDPVELPFEIKMEDSIHTIVKLMKNARAISETENAVILHQAFGVISDSVSQRQPMVTDYFRLRWYADEIFELFSSWQKDNPHSKSHGETPIISSMIIFEKNMIRRASQWAPSLIDDIIKEFQNPSSQIVNEILKHIGKLLCTHPYEMKSLVEPTIECLRKRIKAHPRNYQGDPLISSLLLTLSEIEMSLNHQTTTKDIVGMLFDPDDLSALKDKNQPTWQMQAISMMTVNDIPKFARYCNEVVKINPPPEFFIYLMFAPQIMPDFMNSHEMSSFIVTYITESFKSATMSNIQTAAAFIYTIVEFAISTNLFQALSKERRLLLDSITQIKEDNNYLIKELIDFVSISSFAGAQPIEPELAHKIELENKDHIVHIQGNNSVFSFIDEEGKPLSVIIRSTLGSFIFEIHDTDLNVLETELPQVTAQSDDETKYEIEEDFAELTELLNTVKPLQFKPHHVEKDMRHMRIFSFLASTGIIDSANERNVMELHNIGTFIDDFDAISSKDVIEIGILHFTKNSLEFPGSRKLTPSFATFLSGLGEQYPPYKSFKYPRVHEMGAVRFVYLHLDEDSDVNELLNARVLIIFNDTNYECIEEQFAKLKSSLIISVRMIQNPEYRKQQNEEADKSSFATMLENNKNYLLKMDLLKWNRTVAFPLIHKYPRLVSFAHFLPTMSLMASLDVCKKGYQTLLGKARHERREVLKKVIKEKVPIEEILKFPIKELN